MTLLSAPSRRRTHEPPVQIDSGVYRIVARCGVRTASAVRTQWGWQVGLRRRWPVQDPCGFCGEFHPRFRRVHWLSVDTRDGAELALTRLVAFGGT
jgi:hypothetical protein